MSETTLTNNYTLQKRRGVRLWSDSISLDENLVSVIRSLENPSGQNLQVLKRGLRRCVIRLDQNATEKPALIVKAFPLQKLESRLKYKRYGLSEALNYIHAAELNLPTPEYYGYFEYHSLGTVKANGVLIEDMKGYKTLHDLAQQFPQKKMLVLSLAIPVLKQLFKAGANHIDTTAHNIMVSPSGEKTVVIDWQYCSFHQPEQVSQLTLQATQFLRYTDMTETSDPDWTAWLKELYNCCNPDVTWQTFRQNVSGLQLQKRASAKSRLSLKVPMPCDVEQ